jgi:hypothetical protein
MLYFAQYYDCHSYNCSSDVSKECAVVFKSVMFLCFVDLRFNLNPLGDFGNFNAIKSNGSKRQFFLKMCYGGRASLCNSRGALSVVAEEQIGACVVDQNNAK